jgi:hypothetical protein
MGGSVQPSQSQQFNVQCELLLNLGFALQPGLICQYAARERRLAFSANLRLTAAYGRRIAWDNQ